MKLIDFFTAIETCSEMDNFHSALTYYLNTHSKLTRHRPLAYTHGRIPSSIPTTFLNEDFLRQHRDEARERVLRYFKGLDDALCCAPTAKGGPCQRPVTTGGRCSQHAGK